MGMFPGVKWNSKEYQKLYSRKRRKENPTYVIQQKEYRQKIHLKTNARRESLRYLMDPEELQGLRAKQRASSVKWKRENPEKYMFFRVRDRAQRNGLEFSIQLEDIVLPEFCPVFGYKLVINTGRVKHNSMTLDRIDNTKGYIKGNIIIVSHRANTLKNDATLDELKRIIEFYAKFARGEGQTSATVEEEAKREGQNQITTR